MGIISIIIFGFFAGLLARFLKPGRDKMGFFLTAGLGIVGAVVGTYLGRAVGEYEPGEPASFLGAVVGAIIVLSVWHFASGKRDL